MIGDFFSSAVDTVGDVGGSIFGGLKSAGGFAMDTARTGGGFISDGLRAGGGLLTDAVEGGGNLLGGLAEHAGALIPILAGAGIIERETVPERTATIQEPVSAERGLNLSPSNVVPWLLIAGGVVLTAAVVKKVVK